LAIENSNFERDEINIPFFIRLPPESCFHLQHFNASLSTALLQGWRVKVRLHFNAFFEDAYL